MEYLTNGGFEYKFISNKFSILHKFQLPCFNRGIVSLYIKDSELLFGTIDITERKSVLKFTMKQKETLRKEKKDRAPQPRRQCDPTTLRLRDKSVCPTHRHHNMYLSRKYTIIQIIHVSGHKTQKTFMDYIKLSSEEIADEIAERTKKTPTYGESSEK